MRALGANLAREYPQDDPGRGISVLRADEVMLHPQLDVMVDAGASFLVIVVAMLLAIVCTNLATWLLVRGLARGKEVSVRLALGASRTQVVRHLVVESTLLAALGGAAGYLLAEWAMGFVARLDLPVDVGGLDYRVLAFTVALSLFTGVAFGLAPALRTTRGQLAPALRGDGGIGSSREADRSDTRRVAVVNESLARQYFGTSDPVGRRVSVSEGSGSTEGSATLTELEIIGVVPDVRTSLLDPPGPLIYRSNRQGSMSPSTVLVRTAGDPASLIRPIQRALRDLDASVPIVTATTLSERVADDLGPGRTVVALLGALGVLGLGLASFGLYAVVSFAVSRRSREIGIRTALGARRTEVLWTLSKDVAVLMAGALAVGLSLAWLLVRILGTVVSNLGQAESVNLSAAPAADPVAFALVALIMGAVALAATLFPAWRASGIRSHAVLRDL